MMKLKFQAEFLALKESSDMINIYRFIKGVYNIKLSGEHSQRVLNRALMKKIYITDVKKISDNNFELCVSKTGLQIIKDIAEESNVTVQTLNYRGISKIFSNMKKRWMFIYASVTAIVCVLFSSSFIWEIDVPEVDYIKKEDIIATLKEYGIKEGALRKTIDYKVISNALITKYESLIWANVELSGTRIKVSLVPRTPTPQMIPFGVPNDIIAKKDGVITGIIAENGEKKVKVGDTVIKGQVLISGIVPSTAVGTRYVHSKGKITAKTWTEKEKEQKLYKYEKEFTGNQIKKAEIELPFVKIPLYFKKNIDFYNYESIIKEKNILFLTFREYEYLEYNLKKVPMTLEEAINLAEDELENQIKNEATQINNFKTTSEMIDEETVYVRVLAESEEEIGEEREIEKAEIGE